jgi:nucleotide-binding universal stress UspA family protein
MDAQHNRRTVVVGVDGSDHALRAVRWGAAEAGRRGVPLRLVIAFAWVSDTAAGHRGHGERYREILLGIARGKLADAAVVAEMATPGGEVEQQLIVGSPIVVLADEARRAQVLVVGDRGLSRIEGLLAGSVAVALAAHAPCPVVVVRGADKEPAATAPVVVGVDGSTGSDAAIAFAFEAASARHTGLVAVHSWLDMVFEPEIAAMLSDRDAIETAERQLLSDRLAGWSEKYPDVIAEQLAIRGSPARSLLEQAAAAQLVVVGSRGHGDFTGWVLGSVSNALLHRSPCPVAVVRSDAG